MIKAAPIRPYILLLAIMHTLKEKYRISVGDAVLRSELSGDGGAFLVGYKGGTVQSVLDTISNGVGKNVFSVENYGAKGTWSGNYNVVDDDDDDSDAFQAVFTACRYAGGGAVVCSPEKTIG